MCEVLKISMYQVPEIKFQGIKTSRTDSPANPTFLQCKPINQTLVRSKLVL